MLEIKDTRKELGEKGEKIAEKYLIENGYKILEKNFLCHFGEIDIIAREKDEIVIIEVKTRTGIEYGFPSEAVNKNKQKHIKKTTEYYLYTRNLENAFVRIDIIEVYLKNGKFYVHHIKKVV